MAVKALRAAGYLVTELRKANYGKLAEAVESELAAGASALVVVGGDGMVHLGVNALAGGAIPLGIIPAGTGNDAARGLGIDPKDPAAAVNRILTALDGTPRLVDLGRIDVAQTGGSGGLPTQRPIRFMCALSAGFDALVNERANSLRWPKGPMRYNVALARELLTLKPRRYRLLIDGEKREFEALLISVSNGTSIGGGMKITPAAKFDDGKLDLFVVSPVPRRTFVRIFPRVFSGTHVDHPAVHIEQLRSVEISVIEDKGLRGKNVIGYADGERIGAFPLTVTVETAALSVLS